MLFAIAFDPADMVDIDNIRPVGANKTVGGQYLFRIFHGLLFEPVSIGCIDGNIIAICPEINNFMDGDDFDFMAVTDCDTVDYFCSYWR